MPIESDTNVEEIRQVQDGNGNNVPPANETQQQALRDAVGNQDSLTAFSYATGGTTAESLTANAVPNGISVLLQADNGNAGSVYVGDSGSQVIEMGAGATMTLAVTDTAAIYIQTPNSGDAVNVVYES